MTEHLQLADWRRRVSDLYAIVRAGAETDPEGAWGLWRTVREELFRSHPQSPVPPAELASFTAQHWPYDRRLRFEVAVEPIPDDVPGAADTPTAPSPFGGLTLALPISTGGEEAFTRIGRVAIPFPAGGRDLGVYWMAGYAGGLFVPFRDATNGTETYGAGRYLPTPRRAPTLGPERRPTRSSSTSTSHSIPRVPSTRGGRARSHRRRTGWISASRPASGSPDGRPVRRRGRTIAGHGPSSRGDPHGARPRIP